MNKGVLIGILIALLFTIGAGCEIDTEKLAKDVASENIDKLVVCETPYIRHSTSCCLDVNNNRICDNDEKASSTQPTVPTTLVQPIEPTTTTQPKESGPQTTPETPIIIDKTLSDYPNMFITNGIFNGVTAVGINCAASDTIAQSEILADLQTKAVTKLSNGEEIVNPIPSSAATLDDELQGKPNLIIIDTKGCNSLISLLGYVGTDAPSKTAIIKIEKRDGRYLMLIHGNSNIDTRNAVEAIASGKLSNINKPYAEVKSLSQTVGSYTIE